MKRSKSKTICTVPRICATAFAAADKLPASEIHIGLEATSVYSWHPAMYLHEDATLQERKTKVFTINPKLIHKFREAYADLDKTDRIDAWMIADRLRFGRLTTTIVMQEQYVALQRLTRMRFHLVHNLRVRNSTSCRTCFTNATRSVPRLTAPYSATRT